MGVLPGVATAQLASALCSCAALGGTGLWVKVAQSGSLNCLEVIADPHRSHYLLQAP